MRTDTVPCSGDIVTHRTLTEWLLENGGPVVRYRTAAELLEDATRVDPARLAEDLLESPQVRLWLDRLVPGDLHSNRPEGLDWNHDGTSSIRRSVGGNTRPQSKS